jgi:hypothetical protein
MAPSQKMLELLLKSRNQSKGREFSRARDLKVLSSKQTRVVNNFFASSPVFMRKYGKNILVAARLIFSNLKVLKQGAVVEKEGFVIKKGLTGKTHPGNNTEVALSVSFNGKVFFVKIGKNAGVFHFSAYQKAKDYFKKHNNLFGGYKVEMAPYHLIRLKANLKFPSKIRGVIVSDFFPSDKVTLVKDIKAHLGEDAFNETVLGRVIFKISSDLEKEGILDAEVNNAFFDEAKQTIYFFDLWQAR